ncbi:MAG TPA: YdcF family protein [Polyangiaceae bacterium]|jgi:uncharacterized SAM-binding protein YcdF (DUF218 family)|nr:YdcF family protein [Polyangiaceae bacterium]
MHSVVSARPDAVVVLGCKVPETAGGALHRRAEIAALAYLEHRPRFVVASGGRLWNGVAEATALRDFMVALGVPAHAVVRELWSLTTIENAIYTGELLRAAALVRPLVVTSDWHVERALACFGACGIDATGRAASSAPEPPLSRARRWVGERFRTRVDLMSVPLWFGA